MKRRYWVLLILCFNAAYSSSFDVLGNTYVIAEKDALAWLASRLAELEKNGELERQQAHLKQQALNSIERPRRVEGLQKTVLARTFERDLTVRVPDDIKDQQGKVLYQAGTKINPLAFVTSKKTLLFFDGDDKSQVVWALKEEKLQSGLAKLVLVNGPLAQLSRTHQVRMYFDQAGRLVRQFGIKQVPAIVEQQGDKLRVKEIKL